MYDLHVMPHYRKSFIATGSAFHTTIDRNSEIHVYPRTYAIKDFSDPIKHIEFALKYDGVNLEILSAAFKHIEPSKIEQYVKRQINSKYARIIWFLYEFLLESTLNVTIETNVKYVNVLDPDVYFVTNGIRSKRHRVNNNLLGDSRFCPIVRKTPLLNAFLNKHFDLKAKELTNKYSSQLIERANYYLYTKETLSSYKIEREIPSQDRVARFVEVLQQLSNIEDINKDKLIELQNLIVDPRFRDVAYRTTQNYVGETINYQQRIHYIAPRPDAVEPLMSGLIACLNRLVADKVQAVVAAACIAFGFVFIHPFEDGNGRIHRFLIHYVLAKLQYTTDGIIFPVSAVMLQKIREYDQILESFSKPLLHLIDAYDLSDEGVLRVMQDTISFYQYTDYTRFAEYLFACIEETLHEHFEKELDFLVKYDATKKQLQRIVDMPDRMVDLFIKLACQNHGVIAEVKRKKFFASLTEGEILDMQEVVKSNMLV